MKLQTAQDLQWIRKAETLLDEAKSRRITVQDDIDHIINIIF